MSILTPASYPQGMGDETSNAKTSNDKYQQSYSALRYVFFMRHGTSMVFKIKTIPPQPLVLGTIAFPNGLQETACAGAITKPLNDT